MPSTEANRMNSSPSVSKPRMSKFKRRYQVGGVAQGDADAVDHPPVDAVVVAEVGQAREADHQHGGEAGAAEREQGQARPAVHVSLPCSRWSRSFCCWATLRSASRTITGSPTRRDDDLRKGHVGVLEDEEQDRQRHAVDAEHERLAERIRREHDRRAADRDRDERRDLQDDQLSSSACVVDCRPPVASLADQHAAHRRVDEDRAAQRPASRPRAAPCRRSARTTRGRRSRPRSAARRS